MEDLGIGQALLIGVAAGLIGTAIFTLVEMLEIRLTGRPPRVATSINQVPATPATAPVTS